MKHVPVWSRVIFLALLPFVVYSVWNYIETRRLQSRIDAIEQRGEPLELQQAAPDADELRAERLYRAAAALAAPPTAGLSIQDANRLMTSWRTGAWTPQALAVARAAVDANRDALALADQAAHLPFRVFTAGTSYNYRTSDLVTLSRLLEMRAAVSLAGGNADAALASFYSDAKLARAIEASFVPMAPFQPRFAGLSAAAAADIRATDRGPLASALADLDRDDRLKTTLIVARAMIVSGSAGITRRPLRYPPNPIVGHMAVGQLDAFADLIAAANVPWPRRIDDINAVGVWPMGVNSRNAATMTGLRNFTKLVAGQVKDIRCARLIVSAARLDLIDPFTGRRLEPSQCHL
jgi:hypothetical protein